MAKFDYTTFFDADNFIFNFKIKYSFLEYYFLETLPVENYARKIYEHFINNVNYSINKKVSMSLLNKEYFKNFTGMPVKLMQEIAYSWYYKKKLELGEDFFNQKAIFEIKMHKKNNAQIVILSTSLFLCLEPLMKELLLDSVISVDLEVVNGYYTGNILSDPISEKGKEKAIKDFIYKQNPQDGLIQDECEKFNPFCDVWPDYKKVIFQ